VSARTTYRFGPLERRGLLGPIRGGQAAVVGLGMLGALALLNALPNATGAFLATTLLAAAGGFVTIPVGHGHLDEWVPVTAAFVLRVLGRRRVFRSVVPLEGFRGTGLGSRRPVIRDAVAHPPRELRDVRILSAAHRGRQVGILSSRGGRFLIAVLACRASAFALLDASAQERRLARWGYLLSSAAGTSLTRLQWLERTAPAQGDELARWVHSKRDPAIPPRGAAMIDSYLELIGTTSRVTNEHEILLALQVDARRVRSAADGALRDLLEDVERTARALEAAEVSVLGALRDDQLARALRTAFDPYCRAELVAQEAAKAGPSGHPEAGAWPLGARESWEHYQTDGSLHATFWISGWPRVEVSPMFLDPLIGQSSVVRTVSVVFEPVPPERSAREAEAAVTRDHADRELRHRFGQSQTARQRQAEEAAARREAELAAGHAEVRLAGFVTVSARDEDELRRACAEVTEQAARSRLELRRMYGQQSHAFTFTLPLCRGLR